MSAVYSFEDTVSSAARNGESIPVSIYEIDQRVRVRIGETEVEFDRAGATEFSEAFTEAMKRAW